MPAPPDAEPVAAALALVAALRRMEDAGRNLATTLLGRAPFIAEAHYPANDVIDPVSHAQYYFHAHRDGGESGHIHCFMRQAGIPSRLRRRQTAVAGGAGMTHVAAIALDASGRPARFFTTNLWVTGDDWYDAEDLIALLPAMRWSGSGRARPVSQALSALFTLYRPRIAALLRRRDRRLARAAADDPFADQRLEILSSARIDLVATLARLRARHGVDG